MESEHEMYGKMPVWRLFFKCSIPGMVSGLVWAFCSIVDGIFVGNYLGSDGLAAVNIAWPIMTVFMATSDMIAAGSSVRISMHLGSGDADSARRVFTGSVKLIVAISFGFLFVGVFLGEPIVRAMGAEGFVADTASQYMAVFGLFAPVGLLFFATDNYLRICGAVNSSMWINILVAVLNISLLAILIGWLGQDTWASALATSLSISIGTVMSLFLLIRGDVVLRFVKGRMDLSTVRKVVYNGTSTFFNSVSGSLFGIVANIVLLSIAGNDGVSAYGIMMYVNSIIFSLFTSMNAAMQPAFSYNHGAGNGIRVKELFKVMCVASAALGIAVTALCILADDTMVSLFLGESDSDVAMMAAAGLSVFSLTYLISWMVVNANQLLAATDLPTHALSIGVMSQFVIPVVFLVPMSALGVDGVWWSMVAASFASAVFSAVMLTFGSRKMIFKSHEPVGSSSQMNRVERRKIPGIIRPILIISDSLDLHHEPETVGDLASLDSFMGLDAGHAVPVSGAVGLRTVAVRIQFLSHGSDYAVSGFTCVPDAAS